MPNRDPKDNIIWPSRQRCDPQDIICDPQDPQVFDLHTHNNGAVGVDLQQEASNHWDQSDT